MRPIRTSQAPWRGAPRPIYPAAVPALALPTPAGHKSVHRAEPTRTMAALGVAPGTGAAPGQPAARGRAIRLVRPAVEREPDQAGLEYREFARALRSLPAGPSLTLRRSRRTVWAHGIARTLTARQFELLTYLISVNGAVVSRADLFAAISAGEAPAAGSRTVDMHIARIRERLSLPGVIITVRGRGYRFNSSIPVTHI